jgi:hypothetical protein
MSSIRRDNVVAAAVAGTAGCICQPECLLPVCNHERQTLADHAAAGAVAGVSGPTPAAATAAAAEHTVHIGSERVMHTTCHYNLAAAGMVAWVNGSTPAAAAQQTMHYGPVR